MDQISLESFQSARKLLADSLHRTPLLSTRRLGEKVGASVYGKCENLQKTGSFKARGALHKLLMVSDEAKRRGVVTVSAGNHAQALAWAAAMTDTRCTVVMPSGASSAKVEASRGYGAEVILHGTVHEAFDKAFALRDEQGFTFIHPFDDPDIIRGAGSVGLEIIEQQPDVTVIVVPVGGGGQIAGIAGALKPKFPHIRVFGVEPDGASTMHQSLQQGKPVRVEAVNTIADGLAPPMAGTLNFAVVKEYVEDVVLVNDDEIIGAMREIAQNMKLVVEPSGAAAMAALLCGRIPLNKTDKVVAVLSGGNIGATDLARLFVPEHGRAPD